MLGKIRTFTLDSALLLVESLVTLPIQSQENAPYNKSTPAPSPKLSGPGEAEKRVKWFKEKEENF